MDNRGLCLQLVKAETEDEVIRILTEAGYWDDEKAWRDYGDLRVNFSSVGNQQSQAESALVEKLVNSIDAMLMRECLRKGLDPENLEEVPSSIKEATDWFFGIKRGSLSKVSSSQRSELGQNIALIATGEKDRPCLLVIDKGEGQTPARFPFTLVSLNRDNKVKIPFVQGKFNMGSTGALQFCGSDGLQLIVSRRDPQIADQNPDDPTRHDWGFTIVRRFRPTKGMKTSVFRYLAPTPAKNGKGQVLRFDSQPLPVLPGKHPKMYEEELEWGTLVKMYEYNMKSKTNILLAPFFHLSLLLPEAALPIRVYERRKGFKGQSWERNLAGATVHLKGADAMEPGWPRDSAISVAGHTLPCKIYIFKKDSTSPYSRLEKIVFSVNGQTHGWFEKPFLRRKKAKLSSYLIDSVLIVVNCSDLPREITEDLFMNSRDRLRYNEHRMEIEQQLETMIRENKDLRELGVRRREEELSSKLGDEKPLEDVLRTILEKSPSIARIFKPGSRLHRPFPLQAFDEQERYEGKPFPTFFELRSAEYRVVNSRRLFMEYSTDAPNDYFTDYDKRAVFTLDGNGEKVRFTWSLSNGAFRLGIDLPEESEKGDILSYKSKVTDCFRDDDPDSNEPFVHEFKIEVGDIKAHGPGGKPTHRARSQKKGEKKEGPSGITIPKVKEILEEDWGTEYNRFSALTVKDDGEGSYDFYVNMDNVYLLHDIKQRHKLEPQILKAQYMYSLVLVGLAFLQEDESLSNEQEVSMLDLIPNITKRLGPMLLPMIHDLGDLIVEET